MIQDDEFFIEPEEVVPVEPGIIQNILPPTLQAAVNAAQNVIGEITMMPVLSSDIAAWGYDPLDSKLKIQFTTGRVYLYEGISPFEFEALMLAPSKGSAFWALIRRNAAAHPWIRLV